MNKKYAVESEWGVTFVYADGRARAAAEQRAYIARMIRDSYADGFSFFDNTMYEFLVAKHVGNYSTRLLVQWRLAELMHLNARYYSMIKDAGVRRREGTLSITNDRKSLEQH